MSRRHNGGRRNGGRKPQGNGMMLFLILAAVVGIVLGLFVDQWFYAMLIFVAIAALINGRNLWATN